MKLDKVEICMTAVNAVKVAFRNLGAVCRNCENLSHRTGGDPDLGYCSLAEDYVVALDEDFCQSFAFRDEESCAKTFGMIMAEVENDDAEGSL
jgi:hypothetical protein